MTEKTLREQITTQLKLEKVLADKVKVTQEEIDAFVEENQIKPTAELLSRDFANLKNPFVTLPNTTAETIDDYLQEIEMNPEAFVLSGYHPLDKLNVKMIAPK